MWQNSFKDELIKIAFKESVLTHWVNNSPGFIDSIIKDKLIRSPLYERPISFTRYDKTLLTPENDPMRLKDRYLGFVISRDKLKTFAKVKPVDDLKTTSKSLYLAEETVAKPIPLKKFDSVTLDLNSLRNYIRKFRKFSKDLNPIDSIKLIPKQRKEVFGTLRNLVAVLKNEGVKLNVIK